MGKYTHQKSKEYYESFYGKKIQIFKKNGVVMDGIIQKVRILEEDGFNLYVYLSDRAKNLLKVPHEEIDRVEAKL